MAYQSEVVEERKVERRPGMEMRHATPEHQAFRLLYLGFIAAPIIAGLDKFFHYLVDWNMYLSPAFASLFAGRAAGMMNVVGVVEIFAGLLVAVKPRLGGLIVAVWLWAIIINLLMIPGYSTSPCAISGFPWELWRFRA